MQPSWLRVKNTFLAPLRNVFFWHLRVAHRQREKPRFRSQLFRFVTPLSEYSWSYTSAREQTHMCGKINFARLCIMFVQNLIVKKRYQGTFAKVVLQSLMRQLKNATKHTFARVPFSFGELQFYVHTTS